MLNANFSRYNEISFKLSQINHAIESKRSTIYIPSGRYRGGVGAALTARSTIATTFWLSKTESIENELMKKRAN